MWELFSYLFFGKGFVNLELFGSMQGKVESAQDIRNLNWILVSESPQATEIAFGFWSEGLVTRKFSFFKLLSFPQESFRLWRVYEERRHVHGLTMELNGSWGSVAI